jgi:hypothetical protein
VTRLGENLTFLKKRMSINVEAFWNTSSEIMDISILYKYLGMINICTYRW